MQLWPLLPLASANGVMRSPCSRLAQLPDTDTYRFSRLTPLCLSPVPRKLRGLPMGTDRMYSAVAVRPMSSVSSWVTTGAKNWAASLSVMVTRSLVGPAEATSTSKRALSGKPLASATRRASAMAWPSLGR